MIILTIGFNLGYLGGRMDINYIELIVATTIFIITPGLGFAIIVSRTLSDGVFRGFIVGIGLALGDMTYAGMVLFAFTEFADMLVPYLEYIRYIGAGYLVYLGYTQTQKGAMTLQQGKTRHPIWYDLCIHYGISIGNPKVIVFYIGFLPLFLPLGHMTIPQVLLSYSALAFATVVGLLIVVVFAQKIRPYLMHPKTAPIVNKCIGILMAIVGVLLVV